MSNFVAPAVACVVGVIGLACMPTPAMAVEAPSVPRPAICEANPGKLPVAQARLLAFGNYRGPNASRIAEAQRFFDQGLVFGWGFNFSEAVRSFRAAAQIDPECALCRWGIGWALGPSINHDMQPADVPVALDAIVQARAVAVPGSRERALIEALAARYSPPTADANQLAAAYSSAMRALADDYAGDADLAVLAAEAAMNAHAYDYWRADGRPQAWTPQIIAWLDRALSVAPAHPGAHHYRIHLFEDSPQRERALDSAERVGTLAPIVGHLVHMPSHIFFRLGRYHDAVTANEAAVAADREYAAATDTTSDYALHNLHYWWVSALWNAEGERKDGDTAVRAADQLAAAAMRAGDVQDGSRQHFLAAPALTQVRLRRWRAIQNIDGGPYLQGLMHFARGMSHAVRGEAAAARAELESLQGTLRTVRSSGLTIKNIHRSSDVLTVAQLQLQSAIATARGRDSDALRLARAAVGAEDRLVIDDPPVWPIPARHLLGEALLRVGRVAEADKVFSADLHRHPQNCVALAGLAAARAQRPSGASVDSPAQTSVHLSHCLK